MLRWLLLLVVVAFVVGQLMRLRPSARDAQLLLLRQAARAAGLQVRFWTRSSSGYSQRFLPDSGYSYTLPSLRGEAVPGRWAAWISEQGELCDVAGNVPSVAKSWLEAFQQRYPGAWALLESNETGLAVLWPERGEQQAIVDFSEALQLLKKSI